VVAINHLLRHSSSRRLHHPFSLPLTCSSQIFRNSTSTRIPTLITLFPTDSHLHLQFRLNHPHSAKCTPNSHSHRFWHSPSSTSFMQLFTWVPSLSHSSPGQELTIAIKQVISPRSGSTCQASQNCIVEWLDDGTSPLLFEIGICTVGLYTGKEVRLR